MEHGLKDIKGYVKNHIPVAPLASIKILHYFVMVDYASCLTSPVNRIGCARNLNRCYRYGAYGMHYHIL